MTNPRMFNTRFNRCILFLSIVTAYVATLEAGAPFGGLPRFTRPTFMTEGVINAGSITGAVSISDDGLSIYFDADRPDDLWMATRSSVDADWENATPLSAAVNAGVRQFAPDVTTDERELYFRRSDTPAGGDQWYGDDYLMVSTRASKEDAWNEPVRLPESINRLPCPSHPTVTGDGLELYFQASSVVPSPGQRCRGRDAQVYVSTRDSRDADWGEPTVVQEKSAISPGISPDGLTLFFNDYSRPSPKPFVRVRQSREEEFGPTIELANPPNTRSGFPTWAPEIGTDGTLYFTSDRSGTTNFFGAWQAGPAELCDVNSDGSCDVDDLTRRSLFRVNLVEGSERESDVLSYDISGDGKVDQNDLDIWLTEAAVSNGIEGTYYRGDANLDGAFDSGDLVEVFRSGKYELDVRASWADGDWNGDGNFNSGDFIAAFKDGGYEVGPSIVPAVPEPSSWVLLMTSAMAFSRNRKR